MNGRSGSVPARVPALFAVLVAALLFSRVASAAAVFILDVDDPTGKATPEERERTAKAVKQGIAVNTSCKVVRTTEPAGRTGDSPGCRYAVTSDLRLHSEGWFLTVRLTEAESTSVVNTRIVQGPTVDAVLKQIRGGALASLVKQYLDPPKPVSGATRRTPSRDAAVTTPEPEGEEEPPAQVPEKVLALEPSVPQPPASSPPRPDGDAPETPDIAGAETAPRPSSYSAEYARPRSTLTPSLRRAVFDNVGLESTPIHREPRRATGLSLAGHAGVVYPIRSQSFGLGKTAGGSLGYRFASAHSSITPEFLFNYTLFSVSGIPDASYAVMRGMAGARFDLGTKVVLGLSLYGGYGAGQVEASYYRGAQGGPTAQGGIHLDWRPSTHFSIGVEGAVNALAGSISLNPPRSDTALASSFIWGSGALHLEIVF